MSQHFHELVHLWVFTSLTNHRSSYQCVVCAVLYEIYRPDNKPLTLMLPVNTSVQEVMSATVKPGGDHILVKMNSTGGECSTLPASVTKFSLLGFVS